jgi:hypothetical protein
MKKTTPFDLFKSGETIYFDIARLAQLENLLGGSIINVVKRQDAGVNFCLAGLTVGLKHQYPGSTSADMAEEMQKFFDAGGTLDEIGFPIVRAIVASGIFGKEQPERKNEPKE